MRTVVGVLRGGPSSEYEVSLKSGATVLESLNKERYEARDIFISKDGQWHMHGTPMTPERALRGVDVAFNAMHGEFGEDGQVQRMLDALAVPYTGSDALASALAFNKQHTKEIVSNLGVQVAHGVLLEKPDSPEQLEQVALTLFRTFPHPAVVKPVASGSSVGVTIVCNYHALEAALEKAFAISDKALVEEFIKGKEATVGVIDNFRGEKTYALLPIEIIPPTSNSFYDYDAKYISDDTNYVIPGNFTSEEKEELMWRAKTVHEGMGLSHYSRSDFIVSKRGIYFLEINTLPGMTSHSLIPKAVEAVGSKLTDFLSHVVELARTEKKGYSAA